MNTKKPLVVIVLAFLACAMAAAAATSSVGLTGRYHMRNASFDELPYDDGDISYGLVFESGEANAFWQLGVDYAPDVDAPGIDFLLTPSIGLLLRDRIFIGGVGALATYMSGDDSDWTDIYWQFLLGFEFSLPKGIGLETIAYYPFEKWGDLGDFDAGNIEFGVVLKYNF